MLEVPDLGLASWFWFGCGHWSLIHPWSQFCIVILILKVQRTSMSSKSWFRDFRTCWRFLTEFCHLYLDLDMVTGLWYTHNPNNSSLSWFWRLKEYPCPLSPNLGLWWGLVVPDWDLAFWCWLNICWMVFYSPMIQILDCYLFFEGAKNIHVLEVQIFGIGENWRFLTKVWHPDLGLNMVTSLLYTHVPNFSSLSWSWRFKEYPGPFRS